MNDDVYIAPEPKLGIHLQFILSLFCAVAAVSELGRVVSSGKGGGEGELLVREHVKKNLNT